MGSKKQFLMQSLKRAAALASVLGVLGGVSVGFASAQTAQYQPRNQQQFQATAYNMPAVQGSGVRLPPPTYSPIQSRNSARILGSQPRHLPRAAQQATVNRRALVGQGRMISAGYPQESTVVGTLPQDREPSVLQRDDDDDQDFFGGDQPMPTVPRQIPLIPDPQNPDLPKRQDGELPPELFQDPFKNERPTKPEAGTDDLPNQILPTPPDDPQGEEPSQEEPLPRENRNPFAPKETVPDDQIDYQPGRGLNATKDQSNVYSPPGANDAFNQPNNGVYFVPAYDPIPGTHQSTLAPPAMMHPQYGQAWPGQYAAPYQQQPHQYQQPPYHQPQYQQPPYQQPPYQYPQYQQHPQYQQQYANPQYQQPPAHPGYPPNYSPAPAMYPEQQVYTPVVDPPTNACSVKGPITTARRGLLGKLTHDLKKDWGFGDYESCQDAGNCGGCSSGRVSGCGSGRESTCPVFYIGFQAAYNDAFDVANGQGSELVLDDGTAFFFSLGRMNGRNLRTEIELSFRSNDVSSLLTSDGELPLTGQLQTFSGMANAYWEFVKSPTGRFKPYVGAGVGFLSATADLRDPSDPLNDDQADSSSSFAYQWIAGVNFKVSNHLDLYGEYRFTDAESFGIPSNRDDLSGNFGYSANSVGGGLRWKF